MDRVVKMRWKGNSWGRLSSGFIDGWLKSTLKWPSAKFSVPCAGQ